MLDLMNVNGFLVASIVLAFSHETQRTPEEVRVNLTEANKLINVQLLSSVLNLLLFFLMQIVELKEKQELFDGLRL